MLIIACAQCCCPPPLALVTCANNSPGTDGRTSEKTTHVQTRRHTTHRCRHSRHRCADSQTHPRRWRQRGDQLHDGTGRWRGGQGAFIRGRVGGRGRGGRRAAAVEEGQEGQEERFEGLQVGQGRQIGEVRRMSRPMHCQSARAGTGTRTGISTGTATH